MELLTANALIVSLLADLKKPRLQLDLKEEMEEAIEAEEMEDTAVGAVTVEKDAT